MNYRHSFHAGNHADVLKHVVLLALCDALVAKPAACFVLDTHAGRGLYKLDGEAAQKTGEAQDGIARLMTADSLPHSVYNIGSGRITTNRELAEAVRSVVSEFKTDFLKEGQAPNNRGNRNADIARIRADVGYEPQYPVEKSIPDYVAWLRAGNSE